jgi:type IV secretion system protein VirB3
MYKGIVMSNNEIYTIELDDLALGLTRPPMAFGVMMKVAMFNLMLCFLAFIFSKSFYVIPLFGLLHLISVQLSIKEPRFIELHALKFIKTPPVLNYVVWGKCNSYRPD